MSKIEQSFTIHPVGQGFFYSCNILHNDTVKFRMVFDCGSVSENWAIKQEIENYRDSDFTDSKILDLLVISHFDADHINHIEELLQGPVKVKKLVMPFVTFEERLFLVLRYIRRARGLAGVSDFVIRFILNPLEALRNNFDDETEIFLIDSNITPPPEEPVESEEISRNTDDTRFVFNFDSSETLTEQEESSLRITPSFKGKVKKIKHTINGFFTPANKEFKLMEFRFYKKNLGKEEKLFYGEVEKQFYKELGIPVKQDLDKIIEKVKEIKSSLKIKTIFKKSREKVKQYGKEFEISADVENLNTTALCLLHTNNYEGIKKYLKKTDYIQSDRFEFILTQKFKNGVYLEPIEKKITTNTKGLSFPNVLLTSDSFLLEKNDVKDLMEHYKDNWDNFWLYQIPHHGSKNNADTNLLSEINSGLRMNFINYGAHYASHPSVKLMEDLKSIGFSSNSLFITEYQGLKFIASY